MMKRLRENKSRLKNIDLKTGDLPKFLKGSNHISQIVCRGCPKKDNIIHIKNMWHLKLTKLKENSIFFN